MGSDRECGDDWTLCRKMVLSDIERIDEQTKQNTADIHTLQIEMKDELQGAVDFLREDTVKECDRREGACKGRVEVLQIQITNIKKDLLDLGKEVTSIALDVRELQVKAMLLGGGAAIGIELLKFIIPLLLSRT